MTAALTEESWVEKKSLEQLGTKLFTYVGFVSRGRNIMHIEIFFACSQHDIINLLNFHFNPEIE